MAAAAPSLIARLTDFGTAGWYAACMKAVIMGMCPRVQVVDITHQIPPQDILAAAVTLAAAAPWFPPRTIFACVVDPGVGTRRALLAAQADRHVFVGPDNGLFTLIFRRATRLKMVRLTNPRYWLPDISQTFQGRDIIAPIAAHVACGRPLRQFGVPMHRYQTLRLPPLRHIGNSLQGRVIFIDTFGNLITNLPISLIAKHRTAVIRYKRRQARLVASYGQGKRGELVAVPGSSGYLELAVPCDSAAKRYRAQQGDRLVLNRV